MTRIDRREFLQRSGATALTSAAVTSAARSSAAPRSAANKKIKIGQIGTAHGHAAGKMATMRKLEEHFDVVGVVQPDPRRHEAAQRHSAYRGLTWLSEQQLLETPGLQAIAVETTVRDLVPTAARCVARGFHVHLDKPPGQSIRALKSLLDEASKQERVIQLGYMFRYNPAFQFLFHAVRQGWLGRIFEAHGVISKTVSDEARRELAEYPGGTMFELGCHLIDALVIVLGMPDRVTPFVRHTRGPRDTLADNQLAVFEYPAATATIRSALMEVDGFRRRQFVVCGDEGTIDIRPLEPPQLTLTLARARGPYRKGTHEINLPPAAGRYDGDFLDLAAIVRGEKAPEYDAKHDLAVHETVLRASGVALER